MASERNAPEHGGRIRMRLGGAAGPRGGGLYVSELQRKRLLEAAFAVVAEDGYQGMAVRKVAERAGVSSKTFYDLFSDREDCFLAAFDYGVGELSRRVRPVYEAQQDWVAAVREGLGALLAVLDGEPALRWLVFVEALGVGPRVLARRAEVLQELAAVLDRGRVGVKDAAGLPSLTGEGVVGAAFGVIHARLSEQPPGPLVGLLGELMATIVLPYRGRAAAAREQRGTRTFSSGRKNPAGLKSLARLAEGQAAPPVGVLRPLGSMPPVDFRLTVRRQTVLAAIAELGEQGAHPNNREVSELTGITDQGQISRLMMSLQEQGLVENTKGQGQAKAWRLSAHGEEAIDANRPVEGERRGIETFSSGQKNLAGLKSPTRLAEKDPAGKLKGGELVAPGELEAGFRLTTRTHLVLQAVGELAGGESHPSNREIAHVAGVKDPGQISKLLARLESRGLLLNTGGVTQGVSNAWQLTPRGREVLQHGVAHSDRSEPSRVPR
jgi:AcrR family transcriptional regulator/DNA-binding MarR family transcriptional regulator